MVQLTLSPPTLDSQNTSTKNTSISYFPGRNCSFADKKEPPDRYLSDKHWWSYKIVLVVAKSLRMTGFSAIRAGMLKLVISLKVI